MTHSNSNSTRGEEKNAHTNNDQLGVEQNKKKCLSVFIWTWCVLYDYCEMHRQDFNRFVVRLRVSCWKKRKDLKCKVRERVEGGSGAKGANVDRKKPNRLNITSDKRIIERTHLCTHLSLIHPHATTNLPNRHHRLGRCIWPFSRHFSLCCFAAQFFPPWFTLGSRVAYSISNMVICT